MHTGTHTTLSHLSLSLTRTPAHTHTRTHAHTHTPKGSEKHLTPFQPFWANRSGWIVGGCFHGMYLSSCLKDSVCAGLLWSDVNGHFTYTKSLLLPLWSCHWKCFVCVLDNNQSQNEFKTNYSLYTYLSIQCISRMNISVAYFDESTVFCCAYCLSVVTTIFASAPCVSK